MKAEYKPCQCEKCLKMSITGVMIKEPPNWEENIIPHEGQLFVIGAIHQASPLNDRGCKAWCPALVRKQDYFPEKLGTNNFRFKAMIPMGVGKPFVNLMSGSVFLHSAWESDIDIEAPEAAIKALLETKFDPSVTIRENMIPGSTYAGSAVTPSDASAFVFSPFVFDVGKRIFIHS